jgi:DNA-binding CsgD family transcriptional regulator
MSTADDPLLQLIGDNVALLEIDEFRRGLLDSIRRAVPSDWVSLNDIGPDPATVAVIIDPPAPSELFEKFTRYAHQNPLIAHYTRTQDGRVVRWSDLVSPAELHALDIYAEVYAPMGVEHQLAFTLPHRRDRILGVALSRRTRDFTDRERDLLETARPFLIQAYRNAIRYSDLLAADSRRRATQPPPQIDALRALRLTDRQAQVLQLLATGVSDKDIATHLQISPRTVHKHLERCYRTLAVRTRSEAAAVAWATLDAPENPSGVHGPRT